MSNQMSSPDFLPSLPAVFSVSELNRQVRQVLERQFSQLWLGGEISNFTAAASGHYYFSLKDAQAQVRCVMFRQRACLLPFRPQEGMKVEARVVVSFYEPRGEFQLTVEMMRPAGLGALYEAFERLKSRLAADGLFDPQRKRPLPAYPRALGIITSPAAAALRDVLTTLARRAPALPLILYPSPVQGAEAPAQLLAALRAAARRQEVDVLLLCRGGGSIEDLWAFNDEALARQIAAMPMPVVSGVGHETDFTIADFVADVRAATPTAAAELASPDQRRDMQRLDEWQRRLQRAQQQQLQQARLQLQRQAGRLRHPGERLRLQQQRLQQLALRLQRAMQQRLQQQRWQLARLEQRLQAPDASSRRQVLQQWRQRLRYALQQRLGLARQRLRAAQASLQALNPQAVLARGYSLVTLADGSVLRSVQQVQAGSTLRVTVADGSVAARVEAPLAAAPQQAELPW